MRRRRVLVALVLIVAVLAMAGCSPTTPTKSNIDIDKPKGVWQTYFVVPLMKALEATGKALNSYGLAILVVTVGIRLLLLPLTLKQMKSSKAMQAIQPEMTKLREKYKNNQQKMQEETMKLFQKHNVNPLAGCLPLIVQMPILIAFYQAIINDKALNQADFLWLQLGVHDPLYILPVLAAVTTYLQSVMMGMGDNPQARAFLYIMPIMIFVLAFNFPAALALYWVYGNLFQMVQYYFIGDKFKAKREGAAG